MNRTIPSRITLLNTRPGTTNALQTKCCKCNMWFPTELRQMKLGELRSQPRCRPCRRK